VANHALKTKLLLLLLLTKITEVAKKLQPGKEHLLGRQQHDQKMMAIIISMLRDELTLNSTMERYVIYI
jgi:hypothetical protein